MICVARLGIFSRSTQEEESEDNEVQNCLGVDLIIMVLEGSVDCFDDGETDWPDSGSWWVLLFEEREDSFEASFDVPIFFPWILEVQFGEPLSDSIEGCLNCASADAVAGGEITSGVLSDVATAVAEAKGDEEVERVVWI